LGNFLIWGASGSGKTSFLKEIRRDLQENLPQLNFVELNVAKMDIAEFERKMQEVKESRGAVLCLVDELTTKPEFFKSLFGHLKLNEEEPECRVAFALVGSLAEDLDGFVRSIEARKDDGGPDLIRRVPNRFTIPTAKPADLILVFAGKVVEAAEDKGCVVSEIEAACLFYVLVESLEGHRLESLARGAVSRLQPGETQIKFGHLFEMQHKHNEALERYEHLMGDLRDTFLSIEV